MVRHNNMIPVNHFHKNWQKLIKCWFNQPMKKKRRAFKRAQKQRKIIPKPIKQFRPHVRCPTIRYNNKVRLGRGFSLAALEKNKLHPLYARSIGIAVDYRRRCKSMEQLFVESNLLTKYKNQMITIKEAYKKPSSFKMKSTGRIIREEERKFSAYKCLRKAKKGLKARRKLKELEKNE